MDNVYFDIKWPGPEESLQMTEENVFIAVLRLLRITLYY